MQSSRTAFAAAQRRDDMESKSDSWKRRVLRNPQAAPRCPEVIKLPSRALAPGGDGAGCTGG
ncbi:hypothetical protein LJR129_001860 [Acidovorax sp. LjRoot129]|uniref:hypothetical protein n=1 Tax=Acidovorax sp. LjRoot129 TaxID=3342260 RepID=UPI003ED09164